MRTRGRNYTQTGAAHPSTMQLMSSRLTRRIFFPANLSSFSYARRDHMNAIMGGQPVIPPRTKLRPPTLAQPAPKGLSTTSTSFLSP